MKLADGLCAAILPGIWLAFVISYVAAPCKLLEEHRYTMALFACQSLDGLPAELPTLALVFCLVLCLVLVPGTVLQVSAVRWNVTLHSVGVATLAACALKACLLYGDSKPILEESLAFTGLVTGRAAAMYLGMLLLAISRRSIISDWWKLDYQNMIAFHRVIGWWVLWMSLLHSLAFGFYYLNHGGWKELVEACLPVAVRCDDPEDDCWNTLGLVNGFGVVATAATIILAVFSQKVIRRRSYNLFYFTHLVTSFLFMLFCGLHDFAMAILMFPGLVFYVRDRFTAWQSRGSTEVTVNILLQSEASSLVMLSWYPVEGSRGALLQPGTRWVYCRLKAISSLEWHPYSAIFHGHRAFILLKSAGDWSTSLCHSATGNTLRLDIEGPYGKTNGAHGVNGTHGARDRPALSGEIRTLLIAGGVGIAPFLDLIAGPIDSPRIKLVWAVRGEEYAALAAAIDFQFLRQRADISVFITSPLANMHVCLEEAKIGSELGGEETGEGLRPVPILLLFSVLSACATASDYAAHWWDTTLREHVYSLMEWALLMRVIPIFLVAVGVVLASMGLLSIPRCARCLCRSQSNLDSRQNLVAGEIPMISEGSEFQIQHEKVNLPNLLEQEAQEGPLEVKACGPKRMLLEITSITRCLRGRKFQVVLENLEAEL